MGIVAYYLHVDTEQFQALRERPALVWDLRSDPRFASARLFDIDKDWQIISWLVSDKKRREQEQNEATSRVMAREDAGNLMDDDAAWKAAIEEARMKLGIEKEDTDAIPTDMLLQAIEGRGTEHQHDPAFNFGLGGARVFAPAEVQAIVAAFGAMSEASLRAIFNRELMAKFDVGDIRWLDETDAVFEEILLPEFRAMKLFFQEAGQAKHYALVIYQ